jgi:hypothetical protein
MSRAAPRVTVIMATYGRGRHILPSVRSVLAQDMADFELLVVGDACTDETAEVLAGIADPRLRWMNLSQRSGGQSGPNNAGIAAARAPFVAYIGHDDVWHPSHLGSVLDRFAADPDADLVVSGLVSHDPVPGRPPAVSGLITRSEEARDHHFQPSGLAHRRDLTDRIGPWKPGQAIRDPVDVDLRLRAVAAGMRFVSTGTITVHKFGANARYLSYLIPSTEEQEAILADFAKPGHDARLAAMVEAARSAGRYMLRSRGRRRIKPRGQWLRRALRRRGLEHGRLRPLDGPVILRHRVEDSAGNWRRVPLLGMRRATDHPEPRQLVPVTGGAARLSFDLRHRNPDATARLVVRVNGGPELRLVGADPRRGLLGWIRRFELPIQLRADRASVLAFCLTPAQARTGGRAGIALGPLRLDPVAPS